MIRRFWWWLKRKATTKQQYQPVILVTGCSSGIGLAIAKRAAQDGANIALIAKTSEPHPKLPGTIYTAAKEIEAMGGELTELVRQCEATARDALAVIGELKETAGRYREEAKRVFFQIENCSLVTSEVRKTCAELKEKIASGATTDTKAKKK